jgi:hypothetical protein
MFTMFPLIGVIENQMQKQEILGYTLIMSCGACPEQYDVFDSEGKQVGYLRLRHGKFRADYPDCGGETVYRHIFEDSWKGVFKDEEREFFLTEAVKALQNYIQTTKE